MKRKNGYYWVKYNNEWVIARYGSGNITRFIDVMNRPINEWVLMADRGKYEGGHFRLSSYDFTEINEERILNPDEK